MEILIGQKNNGMTKQPSSDNGMMYGCPVGASPCEMQGVLSPAVDAEASEPCMTDGKDYSEGKDKGLVVGCNANYGNASARTANCNNAVSHDYSSYAGALAVKQVDDSRKHLTSRPTKTNIANNHTATGWYGLADCCSLPFWGNDDMTDGTIGNGVTPMKATHEGNEILDELRTANHEKKLRNLKRFITNPVIVRMGVERCLAKASDSPEKRKIERSKENVIRRIIRELSDETYRCKPPKPRTIKKKGKGDKDRNADIYTVYDRCVQNILLIVLQEKLENKIPRWCYSGIKGRSLWSNDKRYCMVNKIRTYVKNHSGASVGLTDIRHFYESLKTKVVLGVLFETITCDYTRRLLCDILIQRDNLVIGGTLSQMFAMLTLADMDYELMGRFNLQFYGTFGDNRIMMDDDREKVVKAVHWEMSYLEGRYGMEMKNDWHIGRVKNGFMFCKQHFKGSFVNVRSEIRRRAIRAAGRDRKNYAGYHGMLVKCDSKRLVRLIKNDIRKLKKMRNQKGMAVRPMSGDPVKLEKLEGAEIIITDYTIRQNHKDSEFFARFQFVHLKEDGTKHLYVTNNGSFEIKEFFKLVEEGKETLPVKTKVCSEGRSYYFDQFHTTNKEACDLLCKALGI